ncbi:MAG: tetratricopeptide repeat protein [Deltaproteobacteria bacterium]|nr:tetratricopeptide repeat protein [Deltaproteobacteria bacterium]
MSRESKGHLRFCYTGPGLRLFVAALIMVLCAGCATKVNITMLQPAPYHEASITKRIAVLPFTGTGGTAFASELEGLLANIYVNDTQYFTLVDRSAIDKTMSELQLSLSGAIDERTAAQVGRMVGAEAIYTGHISLSECTDTYYKQKRRECASREILYDKYGNPHEGNCVRWRTYSVTCTRRTAHFKCSPKLIDVSTGRILYSRNLEGSAEAEGCEDSNPIPGKAELLEKAKDITKKQFRLDVAPSSITRSVALMDSNTGITSKEAKDKLKQGIAYAGKERMDTACEIWEEARRLSPDAPSILFNLGVCAESNGDYERALTLYRLTDRALGSPDDDVTAALKRAETALKNRQKLQEQLSDQ